jgi:hypothetical protein
MSTNINTAILEIMGEVSYVQKERSKDVKYTLKTENAVIQALRPAMLKHGVFMYPVGVHDIQQNQFEAGQYKNVWNRLVCVHVYRFQHAESDTHIDVEVLGDGADTGDKAGNKSMTTSKKYALLQTFLLETGDDPDTSPSPEETKKVEKTPAKVQPQKQTTTPERTELVKEFSLCFNQLSNEIKAKSITIKGNSTIEEITKALKHNQELLENQK